MNFKDRIVRKLLEFGKKNRLFIYPTLALVAIVTAISHAIRWGRSSGKKLVASVLILSLLFAQSAFIRSSAEVSDGSNLGTVTDADYADQGENNKDSSNDQGKDGENTNIGDATDENEKDKTDGDKADSEKNDTDKITIKYIMVTDSSKVEAHADNPISITDTTAKLYVPSDDEKAAWGFNDSGYTNYFSFSGLFSDSEFLMPITDGTIQISDETDVYEVYYAPTRKSYPLLFTEAGDAKGDLISDKTDIYNLPSVPASGTLYPPIMFTVGDKDSYNAYKWGYSFEGLTYNGYSYEVGKNFKINPQSHEPITFLYTWAPYEVGIVFDLASDKDSQIEIKGEGEKTVTKSIEDNITLFSEAEVSQWAGKEGYYLSGWTDGNEVYMPGETISVSSLVENTGNISDAPNVKAKKLTAIWSYKDIGLTASGDNCKVSMSDAGVSISGVYGDEISCTISAYYQHDNSEGNKFSYSFDDSDIFALGGYGLDVTKSSDGEKISSYKISGKLTNITSEPITMSLHVVDGNKPEDSRVTNHAVTITSSKRPITVDGTTVSNSTSSGKPTKVYDGSDSISVATSAAVLNKVEGDDVSVKFDSIAVLDNPNAGKNKTITLKSLQVVGTDSGKYTLDGYDEDGSSVTVHEIAEVTRRPVSVAMSLRNGESNQILFGQETPAYTLSIVDLNELTDADQDTYSAAGSDDARENFFANYMGFGGYDTLRQIYSPKGSYVIKPVFDDSESNYTVNTSGLSATFAVGRDAGTKDVDYKFSSEQRNGYYPGLTITPYGKYNKIRLLNATDGDIDMNYSRKAAEALFSQSITLPDMTNGTVSFQLLGTADGKGAISEIITLKNVNIDSHPPEYVSHSVSPNSTFFNQYSFGSYFHKQSIDGVEVESVTISVEFKTNDSACDKLYYFFADESGNPKADTIRETPMIKNALGNYVGTIIVGTGLSGQIIVYASDTTGNLSTKCRIKMSDIDEFLKNNGKYYEWMVENTINAAVINAYNKDGSEASDAEVWHNGITFVVDAVDGDSGVNRIEWYITKPDGTVEKIDEGAGKNVASVKSITKYGKILEYNFVYGVNDAGKQVGNYSASAILYDNAGNSVTLNTVGPFMVDCKAPLIEFEEPKNEGYSSGVTFDFTVTEGENESGVSSVRVYADSVSDGTLLKGFGVEDIYHLNITSDGKYIIVAEDLAGNVSSREVTFKGISDVFPEDPIISVKPGTGKLGNDGWYIEEYPTIIIEAKNKTSDNVPVVTKYTVKTSKKELDKITDSEKYEFVLTESGLVTIEAYSESEAGCKSNTVSTKLKVDTKAPDAYITESTLDEDGRLWVSFRATDEVSGVDTTQVTVNGNIINVEEIAGVVNGKFMAADNTDYSIIVKDKAGNVADEITFTPLNMKVSPITDITDTSANINADIYVGTYDLADSYIAYRPVGSGSYDTCLSNKYDTSYGIRMEYMFHDLKPDTEYEYRVCSIAKISKETRVVEGKFKTTKSDANGTLYGTVSYGESLNDTFKTYPIYVNIYNGNTIVAGTEINDEVDNKYSFENLADGTYRVVATNGLLTRETAATIENSGVVYPKTFLSTNGINFVLSGLSTRVIIADGAICLAADGLDKIYNTALYNGNVTDADMAVVAKGGSIDIALYASYIDVNDVGQTTQDILQDKIGKNGEIKKYIQLYIVKTVRDANGNLVNGTPTNLTRLAEKITVAFPLDDLAGEKIYVASLHGDNSDYSFINWDSSSDIQISSDYVTISTDRFSVYALYKLNVKPNEYTVKWIDGDGVILKTEKVIEGNTAIPPIGVPKKSSSKDYYYEFVGWDSAYDKVNGDMVIAATFVPHKKNDTATTEKPNEEPTTETPTTEATNKPNKPNESAPDNSPTVKPSGSDTVPNNGGTTPDKKPSGDSSTPAKDDTKPSTSKNNSDVTYTYMGSADSPRTADTTPIVLMIVLMVGAASGLIILNKKKNKYVD